MTKARNIADLGSNDVIETTSTGVDVTGTVTADGFQLGAGDKLYFNADRYFTPENNVDGAEVSANGKFTVKTGATPSKSLVVGATGDVSFYEDTGTTAKMVWYASEEQLQITSANSGAGGWTENVYLKASQYPSLRFWETTGGKVASIGNNGDGSLVLSVNGSTGSVGTNALVVNPSGNVGINTSSPVFQLDVVRGSGLDSYIGMASNGNSVTVNGLLIGQDSAGLSRIYQFGANPITLWTNNAERARIDSSGNLLVGKTSLNSAVDGIELRAGGRLGATFDGGNPAFFNRRSSDGEIIRLLQDDAIVGTVGSNSTGDLYIAGNNGSTYLGNSATSFQVLDSLGSGTPRIRPTTDNVANLGDSGLRFKDMHLGGIFYGTGTYANTSGGSANVGVAADGAFYRSTSSLRYKTDVQDAQHGLTEVMTLRPVTYRGINDGDTVFGGLIAEEVHEAGLTEFVEYNEDNEPDALAYANMVSLCIKAIQEQQEIIENLKSRIETLENN